MHNIPIHNPEVDSFDPAAVLRTQNTHCLRSYRAKIVVPNSDELQSTIPSLMGNLHPGLEELHYARARAKNLALALYLFNPDVRAL